MSERSENYNAADTDAEATLVTPRFDAEEARQATPVVPIPEARARAPFMNPRARARRGQRRPWPTALLAVALLAVFAVGGAVASKVLRREQPSPAAQAPASAPAQPVEAAAQTETSPADEAAREVADAKPEPRATRDARARRAQPAPLQARPEPARDDAEDSEDDDKDRRKRREKRRERAEDEADKEMRKALKRAKGKAPRLVDVLVNP